MKNCFEFKTKIQTILKNEISQFRAMFQEVV